MNAILFLCMYAYLRSSDASQSYFYGLFFTAGLWYGPAFWATLDRIWLKFNRKLDEWADV